MSLNADKNIENAYDFDPTILRAYDIRGIIGETLSDDDAYALGRSYASYLFSKNNNKKLRIAVAYDGRLSSPSLEKNLVEGLKDSGVSVIRVGLCPTPMLYFSVRSMELNGGIMITGSHNPPSHNGFKMMLDKAALFGDEIQKLGEIAKNGLFVSGNGSEEKIDIFEEYLETVLSSLELSKHKRDLKIAWDSGNGAAGEVMEKLTQRMKGEHILLNEKIDGTFPAHHPDPSEPENLEQLIDEVIKNKCDIGIAFDGDGDRIGAIDSKGRILWGDQLVYLYAKDVLEENPGATVIADVKASQVLFEKIAEMGGDPLIWKTGHSFIKDKMAETGAKLAGEMSGHIFFADKYYGFDDGLYAAIRLINIVSKSDKTLVEMIDEYPQVFNTPEIRIDVTEERKFAIIDEIKQRLNDSGTKYSDIDGARVMKEKGWWLIRASNTQACLVARCEADSETDLAKMKNDLKAQLSESGIEINLQ